MNHSCMFIAGIATLLQLYPIGGFVAILVKYSIKKDFL